MGRGYSGNHPRFSHKQDERYDAKEAYNKDLTASARLHYLENDRHDHESPANSHCSPMHLHNDRHIRRQAERIAKKNEGDVQDIYYELKSKAMKNKDERSGKRNDERSGEIRNQMIDEMIDDRPDSPMNRIDKMGVILNNGQIPLVKSRYLKHIYNEEHPYGINAIVAIGCYGSYNVEDSILFNEGSIKRGMFNTTYFNMYEAREESSKVANTTMDSKFSNIENENVIGKKPGYDYSELDNFGLIKENTLLDDKKVIIGKVKTNLNNPNNYIDSSITPKKGQLGFVDKSFITEGEEGFRISKITIPERVTTTRCG